MTMGCKDVPLIEFFDAIDDGVDIFARCLGITVATNQPDDIVEIAIALSHVAAPGPALRWPVLQGFLHPTFIGADVAQINWSEQHLKTLLGRFANYPIGMLEVFFIGRGEIARRGKGSFAE